MKGKLTNIKITEQELMEGLLNEYCSGGDWNGITFKLALFSFVEGWHKDKLFYYIKLLENVK